jgi:hypothetical protein
LANFLKIDLKNEIEVMFKLYASSGILILKPSCQIISVSVKGHKLHAKVRNKIIEQQLSGCLKGAAYGFSTGPRLLPLE